MRATLQPMGADLLCQMPSAAVEELRIPAQPDTGPPLLARLQGLASRYERATRLAQAQEWLAIGTELFALLDANGWAAAFADGAGERVLTLQVSDPSSPLAAALLDAPWELLAGPQGFLAGDGRPLFITERRIGRPQAPLMPRFSDLKLMFMAAAPEGEQELDFEAEEASILQATMDLKNLHLVVEETGAISPLRARLASEGEEPFDALHLSCHGGIHPQQGPMLMLEAEEGGAGLPATPQDLVHAIGQTAHTPLVFVSACRTAEQLAASPAGHATGHTAPALESFVRQLVRAGVHNVLGWDGSVYDHDAKQFAASFYGELVAGRDVPAAAAHARQTLLHQHQQDAHRGSHWHLARLYLGSHGDGSLVRRGSARRRMANASRRDAFLDRANRSPVAPRDRFVGRRRPIQAVLRAFSQQVPGVLVQGMGNLGKSSLAARIRDRLTGWTPVVLFQQFDAAALIDALIEAAPAVQREDVRRTWRQAVIDRPALLADALEALLLDTFDQQPILLILDDLEQALAQPTAEAARPLVPVLPHYRESLGAVLHAFAETPGRSRLLITSRYRFSLVDDRGTDLATGLHLVPLRPMVEREQQKQLRAAASDEAVRTALAEDPALNNLAARALALAQGNPGLQNVLTQPLLNGETAAAGQALAVCEAFCQQGVAPASLADLQQQGLAGDTANALLAFFTHQAFTVYRDALTPQQLTVLRSASAFTAGIAIPQAALLAGALALGHASVKAAEVDLRRLLALGLVDDWEPDANGNAQSAANPLAAPLAGALSPAEQAAWAKAVHPQLTNAWLSDRGAPRDARSLELWRLLCLADAPASPALDAVAVAAGQLLERAQDPLQARDAVLKPTWQKLMTAGQEPSAALVHLCFDVGSRTGDTELAEACAARMSSQLAATDGAAAGSALLRLGDHARERGQLDDALRHYQTAEHLFTDLGDLRERAIALGGQADILHARGQLDEALRIRTDEELPVYERLGDVRSWAVAAGKVADILRSRGWLEEALRIYSEQLPIFERLGDMRFRAVTMGRIADILGAQGQLAEALRIRNDEQLPVYERLGDVREKAVALGQIADILRARGQLDEALRIRTDEELPVYERLGDVRSKAVTLGKIADILHARGQPDEAMRIRTDEELPVYERLGDVRSKAVTLGKIADILHARGLLDEALRIRTDEQLPVYERLGGVREKAVTLGKIADILHARGLLDEALRIRTDEQLPVYERLGDVREKAVTVGQIADILHARGQLDEALRIRTEEQLPAFERLGNVRSKAVTMGKIADILHDRGQLDEALRIHTNEELPVYERLGDVRERAVTLGKIADILHARGQLDEALRIRTEEQLPAFERLGDLRSKAVTLGQIADILHDRGQLDEALRIHTDEELPVYERLGDVHSKAVTMGQIADILHARGQLDEALRLHEQRLPIIQRLGDDRETCHVRFCIARIALDRGDLEREAGAQAIFDNLSEAWTLAREAGRADAVAGIGSLLAQVLAMAQAFDEAMAVLDEAGAAYERMGVAQGVAHVAVLRERIGALRAGG